MSFVVVPIVFGEGDWADGSIWVFEDGKEGDALERRSGGDPSDLEEGGGDVDGGDEAIGNGVRWYDGGPPDDKRGFDTGVVDGCFITGEGTTVVGHEEDEGILGDA